MEIVYNLSNIPGFNEILNNKEEENKYINAIDTLLNPMKSIELFVTTKTC